MPATCTSMLPRRVYGNRLYMPLEESLAVYDARGCGQSTCPYLYLDFAGGMVASIASSPAIANGVVYVGRNSAEVLAFKAKGCGQPSCGPIWSGDTNDQGRQLSGDR
jgi:hypothetical protein